MTLSRQELSDFYHALLNPDTFSDYGPNGLQVEGTERIEKIAFAVSATRFSVEQAAAQQADALVVHHGLFWKFHGARTLTGPFAKRVFPLIQNDINLYGYHLPLDAHEEVGNAAALGGLIGCRHQQPFGDFKGSSTGVKGLLDIPVTAKQLKHKLEHVLQHSVILATPNENEAIESVGIITGGANGEWLTAYNENLDAYITGEISEHDWHESQEAGIHMFAGGHHATEQFGIQALMKKTREQLGIECIYIDSENPA